MKVLVTGGAGFIGSHFVRDWLTTHPNDELVNLDLLTYAGRRETLADLETNPSYRFVEADICDEKVVNDLVAWCDLIVHFAAETHVDRSIENNQAFIKTNVEGTRTLLEAARKQTPPRRFHHVSTDEVFGALQIGDKKFTETTPYDPRSPYSASKAASDHLVRAFFHTYKLPITISNCSNNYGSHQFPEKLIPLCITNLLHNKKVPVYGKGEQIRDWIFVGDHVAGIIKIIEQGKIGETYCLGGDSEMTNITIVKKILAALGQDESMIEYVADRPGHDFRYAIDFSKAQRDLNWTPSHSFDEALTKTIEWYKENSAWWQPLLG
jgi:dTDP-glucose 4,6-dehydratase